MQNKFSRIIAIPMFLLVTQNAYCATNTEELLQSFSTCSGEFFTYLKNHQKVATDIAPIVETGSSVSFAVPNREVSGKNLTRFPKPVGVFDIHLTGYFDEISSISPNEQYYYWGFFITESPEEVYARLKNRIHDSHRLAADGQTFVRLDMHDGKQWVSIESPQQFSGKVPGTYVERVLLIEKSELNEFPGSRLSCSIQGPVSDIILADVRPDLPSKDYPARPKYSGLSFESVPLEPQVENVVNNILKGNALRPKFKTASLKYKISKEGRSDFFLVETYQTAENGLINKREIYSSNFFVDRLMLWNLVQLKSKLSDSDIFLTREIRINPPKGPKLGESFETEVVTGKEFNQSITRRTCSFGQEYPANEIHKLLNGVAYKVSCTNSVTGESDEYAFLQELGMFVHRAGVDKDKNKSIYELIDFNSNLLEENRFIILANKTNESLPKMIDQETRLDSTVGSINSFQFNYTLINHTGASGKSISKELEERVTKHMCTSKDMLETFIRRRATVTFSYLGKDKKNIAKFSVSPSQCIFWQQMR